MPFKVNRREFLKRLLLAVGGTAASGCKPAPPPETRPASGDLVQIIIPHINDFHGALHAEPEDGGERGGAANLVGLIDRKRASAPGPVLLLDAGDAFQGTYVSNSNYGQAVVEVMSVAGVSALALGNHEFDWGLDVLQARTRQAEYPFLAANMESESGRMLEGVLPYTILDADG